MILRKASILAVSMIVGLVCAWAAGIAGTWTAQFDTQVGPQKYTFEFKVEGTTLTGRALGNIAGEDSQSIIQDGKINGDEISFVEMQKYQGQEVKIVYKGRISGDEIKFTRNVADMINEELVAKRVQ